MIMSDQLEFDGSNLCTTVDAFERFQAMSMYEENEYIVLSDILPVQRTNQDTGKVGKDQLERAIDSEIILLSNTDDQYVNTGHLPTNDLVSDLKSQEIPLENTMNNCLNPQVTGSHMKNINAKKSNDQLKITTNECFEIGENRDDQSESIQDIQNFIKKTETSMLVTKINTKTSKNKTRQRSIKKKFSRVSPSTTLERPATKTLHSDLIGSITKKKRGRPRKESYDKKAINNAKSVKDLDSTVLSGDTYTVVNILNESITNKSCTPIPSKGRKSKRIHNDDICKKDSEIPKPNSDTNNPDNNKLNSSSKTVKIKTHRRRGRPKKLSNETVAKQPANQLSTDNIKSCDVSDFENEDDVCLSKLSKNDKSTVDIDKASKQIYTIIEDIQYSIPAVDKLNEHILENESKDLNLDLNSYISGTEANNSKSNSFNNVIQIEDEDDDICLTKLKETNEPPGENKANEILQTPHKRNSKMAIMSDFEYNIDSIVRDSVCNDGHGSHDEKSLFDEDSSKRPVRRKTKQLLHYDEGSDEDPFANVELSDDETLNNKKGRYYSDDEYKPGGKRGRNKCSESSDSEINMIDDESKKSKRKKTFRNSDSSSPKKKGRKCNKEKLLEASIPVGYNNDIEECLEQSVIKTSDECNSQSNTWGSLNEFENFLAKRIQGTNLKIKKVSSTESAECAITPLRIPTINPNEPKKTLETSSQTNPITTSVAAVQTSTRYDIPLKENLALTSDQSEKACEFLKSIVQTTAELGQLMTKKSDDFIKKKINIEHVIDTFKMDYCVKKSFLLLKLAKHNLTEMEDNLAQQYELFLQENKLTQCREEPLQLESTVKDSDSDCEIVEEPVTLIKPQRKSKTFPNFNPKTVFLNKELSIKIAKKPNEEKKLNIKGKHTVWINDSVMVKKVKPSQSFLAQDSRNKKPPDYKYVTLEMVSDFFDKYNHKKMLRVCAQFTSQDWFMVNEDCVCNYFVIKPDISNGNIQNLAIAEEFTMHTTEHIEAVSDTNATEDSVKNAIVVFEISKPETLFTLCTRALQNQMYVQRFDVISTNELDNYQLADGKLKREPETLIQLSLKVVSKLYLHVPVKDSVKKVVLNISSCLKPQSLKSLCYRIIKKIVLPN